MTLNRSVLAALILGFSLAGAGAAGAAPSKDVSSATQACGGKEHRFSVASFFDETVPLLDKEGNVLTDTEGKDLTVSALPLALDADEDLGLRVCEMEDGLVHFVIFSEDGQYRDYFVDRLDVTTRDALNSEICDKMPGSRAERQQTMGSRAGVGGGCN